MSKSNGLTRMTCETQETATDQELEKDEAFSAFKESFAEFRDSFSQYLEETGQRKKPSQHARGPFYVIPAGPCLYE